jgi:hypothetical protein
LFDSDAFIGLFNHFSYFLNFLDKIIDSVGGFKGAMLGLTGLMTKLFSSQIAKGIDNMMLSFKFGAKEMQAFKEETVKLMTNYKGL